MTELVQSCRLMRTAAHDLANICAAVTGGVEMAIGISYPLSCACDKSKNCRCERPRLPMAGTP